MARLDEERRRFCAENLSFVHWVLLRGMTHGMRTVAIVSIGSEEDVYQILALEFCKAIACVKESEWLNPPKIPSFAKTNMIARVAEVMHEKRNVGARKCRPLEYKSEKGAAVIDVPAKPESPTLEDMEVVNRIKDAINRTPNPLRSMLWAHLIDGESYKHIARQQGMSDTGVRKWVLEWIADTKTKIV